LEKWQPDETETSKDCHMSVDCVIVVELVNEPARACLELLEAGVVGQAAALGHKDSPLRQSSGLIEEYSAYGVDNDGRLYESGPVATRGRVLLPACVVYIVDFGTRYWDESYPYGPGSTYVETLTFLLAQPYVKRVWYKSDMDDGVLPCSMNEVREMRAAVEKVKRHAPFAGQ
jgi:hypothetical protein